MDGVLVYLKLLTLGVTSLLQFQDTGTVKSPPRIPDDVLAQWLGMSFTMSEGFLALPRYSAPTSRILGPSLPGHLRGSRSTRPDDSGMDN